MSAVDNYRDGKVHVLSEMCATCVFRPGNLMSLSPGRLKDLVRENLDADSALTCHSTLYGGAEHTAVCRGFFDRYKTASAPLRIACFTDCIEFDEPPERP